MAGKFIFDFSKLKGRVKEVLGSQERLAEELGISTTALSKKFNNKTLFSVEDIILICRILDIPNNEIDLYFYIYEEV